MLLYLIHCRMTKFFEYSALIVLLGLFVEPCIGIKCWECRSDTDPKCADPFDNSTVPITDCKQEPDLPHLKGIRPKMCRKIRQKVNGEWRYFRSCAYVGEVGIAGDERFCLMRTGTYNIFMEYCTCDSKDGCNSASSYRSHHLLLCFGVCISVLHNLWRFLRAFR